MNFWLQTGQGLEVLADVEMTLFDPTGAVGAAHDLQQGNYANLGISLAFRAGAPALSKFFGVTTSKLFFGSVDAYTKTFKGTKLGKENVRSL